MNGTSQTVSVVAPRAMRGGYSIVVSLDDHCFPVTVPEGGVEQGQSFTADIPVHKRSNFVDSPSWKYGMFDCLRLGLFHPYLLNAVCCPHILLSQLLSRMKVADPRKEVTPTRSSTKASLYLLLAFLADVCILAPLYNLQNERSALYMEFMYAGWSLAISLYALAVVIRLRQAIRAKHSIPAACCCQDALVLFCCNPCALMQMARQTENDGDDDDDAAQASCCTVDGLAKSKRLDVCMMI